VLLAESPVQFGKCSFVQPSFVAEFDGDFALLAAKTMSDREPR